MKCKLTFNLPEFTSSRLITHKFHVMEEILPGYDMIIGRDLMELLKLDVKFSTSTVEWTGEGEIPLKPPTASADTHFFISDPANLIAESDRMSTILDAKYSKADLDEVANTTPHLSKSEKKLLKQLLKNYESLFDGTVGTWNMDRHKIELKEGAKPYHGKPYTVPKAYEQALKKEINRLVKIGILRKVNHSQ